jgi:hypothetical protein
MKAQSVLLLILLEVASPAQNVVEDSRTSEVLPPVKIDASQVERLIARGKLFAQVPPNDPGAARIAGKLTKHVEALVEGWPWRPFHCTLGISGSETYFDHPDELFHALSVALPYLPEALQLKVRELLARQLSEAPPCGTDGFERDKGRARERYEVPASLRASGRGQARSLFGIAAFEAYLVSNSSSLANDAAERIAPYSNALIQRVIPYLDDGYAAELEKAQARRAVDLEVLNGDLAGLIAFARLTGKARDPHLYARVLQRINQMAEIRVGVERTDPQLLSPAQTASKRLHHVRLVRFGNLLPEIVELFEMDERKLAAKRLRLFREARPGWWMAFGDRYIGGENYISPPHFSHAVFAGAALVEKVDRSSLMEWIDVPWCEADLFFIEKCALALREK